MWPQTWCVIESHVVACVVSALRHMESHFASSCARDLVQDQQQIRAHIFTLTTSPHLSVAVFVNVTECWRDVLQSFSLDVVARAAAILVGALEADDLMSETRGKKLRCAEPSELTPDQLDKHTNK